MLGARMQSSIDVRNGGICLTLFLCGIVSRLYFLQRIQSLVSYVARADRDIQLSDAFKNRLASVGHESLRGLASESGLVGRRNFGTSDRSDHGDEEDDDMMLARAASLMP